MAGLFETLMRLAGANPDSAPKNWLGGMKEAPEPYRSPLQKGVDTAANVVLPFNGPSMLDDLTGKLLYDEDDQFHPKGSRRGSVENVLKAVGKKFGTLIDEDGPYLEQYLHPDKDVLPKTEKPPLRPGTLPYREPFYDNGKPKWANTVGLGGFGKVDPKTGYTTNERFEINRPPPLRSDYVDIPTKDNTHLFDIWDFDSKAGVIKDKNGGRTKIGNMAGDLAKVLLQRAGQPYAIYGPMEKEK